MPDSPSRDEKLSALEASVSTLLTRADSLLARKDDAGSLRDDLRKMVADAVRDALRDDDRRRDRHRLEDDAEPEEGEEGEHKSEPREMPADDNRLADDDSHDRRDRRHRDDGDYPHEPKPGVPEWAEPKYDDRRDKRADAVRRQVDDENNRLEAQYLLDQAFNAVTGEHAPKPISGQSCRTYQTYCLKRLQRYSDDYRDIDLSKLPADAFALADKKIRADAIRVGSNPQEMNRFIPNGALLREIKRQDRTGRWISEFIGDVAAPNGMFTPFRMPAMRAKFDMDLVREAKREAYRR
jgi:hypothetical protein